jgi:1-aminocyclopropane-1-carboxylate deaminase
VPDRRQRRLHRALAAAPRVTLACLPTPIHPLHRLTAELGGPEIWIKRDDLTGLAGGGNKTRKLEFLVGDALDEGADTLLTVGAVQSNHTRQTAAAAARVGLDCVLLHNNWTAVTGRLYRSVGNILLSQLLGARLVYDEAPRPIGDEGVFPRLVDSLRAEGRRPYAIPGGASEHRLGGFGYAACAAEISAQARQLGVQFDAVVHCTGSGSTQAGLIAGFAALGVDTRVIGISDDDETVEKTPRVLRLANATLDALDARTSIAEDDVTVLSVDSSPYGAAEPETLQAIELIARTEGLLADPVYEGKSVRGLIQLIRGGELRGAKRVLLLHLGGAPAVHAYADTLPGIELVPASTALGTTPPSLER